VKASARLLQGADRVIREIVIGTTDAQPQGRQMLQRRGDQSEPGF
jgi:hypothetical protein